MADQKKYKVGITVKEPWANNISYEVLDMTLFAVEDGGDGCSYVALKPNIGVTPGTDPTTWQKSTQAGQSIYNLAVKYHHFEGTEEEFEQQYQQVLQDARDATTAASTTNTQVQEAEALRVGAENEREVAENRRVSAEEGRTTAEGQREDYERNRRTSETARVEAENARTQAETSRENAETARNTAETARAEAEAQRQSDTSAAITDTNTARDQADAAATRANTAAGVTEEINAHPARISATTGNWEFWDSTEEAYVDSGKRAVAPIADNLQTNDSSQALSAKQGVVLDGKISQLGQEKLDKDIADDTLYITDSNGCIIAKIDKDGVHSVDFKYSAEGDSIKRKLEDIFSSDILFGKKICCCGDSITYGADMDSEGIAQESSINVYQSDANGNFTKVSANFRKTYGYQIAERHKMTFYNAGVSGSTMQGLSDKHGFSLVDGRYTKLPDELDIITIFFGWNDNAYGTLGTIDDNTNESFYGGYNVVLPYLLNKYPFAKIVLIVPYGTTEGHRNAVRLLADKWGVACFDMYQGGTPLYYGKEDYVGVESDVVSANRAKYQAIGAHPNYKGHTAIGDMLESYLFTGVVNVDGKIKQSENKTAELIAEEEERAKAVEATKLDAVFSNNAFYFTDSNGYIIAKIDKDGIHSAKDKHAVAGMVLSESYYPIAAPTRDSDGNVTYVQVMFETGVTGSVSITYTNGNSSSVDVVYGNYNYTITINRDSDGNVETVNIQ